MDEKNESESITEKFSVDKLFNEWSKPIGLVLFSILMAAQIILNIEPHAIAWAASGALMAGDRLTKVLTKK